MKTFTKFNELFASGAYIKMEDNMNKFNEWLKNKNLINEMGDSSGMPRFPHTWYQDQQQAGQPQPSVDGQSMGQQPLTADELKQKIISKISQKTGGRANDYMPLIVYIINSRDPKVKDEFMQMIDNW